MSFDYLKKETTKRCFLFCALYPEDHSIVVEDLVRYAWGLELYGLADSIEDVRIQVSEAITYLKESCLLLEDENEDNDDDDDVEDKDCLNLLKDNIYKTIKTTSWYVKLHDIVRDVALWITSKQENGFTIKTRLDGSFEPCKAISLLNNEEKRFPEKMAHSKLEMLLLNNCDVQVTCFQAMRELKVLNLILSSHSPTIISLYALASLVKLRTLHLENFKDLSFLGNLEALEILTLRWSRLEGLAEELVRLENLKILDVTRCTFSSMFPTNVIRRMFKLEELYLQGNNKVNFDDTIPEINSLSRLTALSLQVSSFRFMEGFEFSKLERYNISTGRQGDVLTEKCWIIQEIIPLNVVSLLPQSLESLKVSANADEFMECLIDKDLKLSNLKLLHVGNLSGTTELPTQHVRVEGLVHLRVEYCSSLKFLFSLSLVQSLVSLETLEVSRCHGLKQIVTELEGREVEEEINSHHSVCFPKLRKIHIKKCGGLEYMFRALSLQGHQGLSLSISDCPQLKQVIKVDNDIMLQQLQFLGSLSSFSVRNCPLLSARLEAMKACLKNVRLSAFKGSFNNSKHLELCETSEDHNMVPEANEDGLNGLTSLEVEECEDFECLVDTTKGNGPTSALTSLETLSIRKSHGLETLCKGQPPHGFLKNLKELAVRDCSKFQVVFEMEQNQEKSLSNLQSLELLGLEELRWIFKGSAQSFSLRSLKVVEIERCWELESIFSPSLIQSLIMLEQLKIESCDGLKALFTEPENDGAIESNTSSLPLCLPKLETLHICRCSKLECVVPITLAQGLPALASLQVSDCEELKQVLGVGNRKDGVEHDGEIESNTSSLPLCLPKLKTLHIYRCSKLECVVPITLAQGLPALESLQVSDCKELKQVLGMGNRQDGVEHDGEIESNTSSLPLYLPKLKTLRINSCSKLEFVVPITLAQGLPALELLEVSNCKELKQVFRMGNGQDGVEHDGEIESSTSSLPLYLPKLNDLSICFCSKLESVVPENYIVKAPVLKCISVFCCPEVTNIPIQQASKQMSLKTDELPLFKKLSYNTYNLYLYSVWDHKNLVPEADLGHLDRLTSLHIGYCNGGCECLVDTSEAMKGQPFLQNLKTLSMEHCDDILEVFRIDLENQPQLLSNLEHLEFEKLYKLREIVKGLTHCVNLQSLKVLDIKDCWKLRWLFSVSVVQTLVSLEELKIVKCYKLKGVFTELDGTEPDTLCLPNLKTMEIEDCESLEYVFPLALAAAFPRLQKIRLVDLGSLRSVVAGNICLEAPALECLHVHECPVFTEQVNKCVPLKELSYSNFGGVESRNMENSQLCQRSQNFEYITVGNCEQLLQLQGGYFVSNLEKMFLGNLIWLRDIWKGSIHVATNLRKLEVYSCNSLTYIFPVMLIPHLPQLNILEIVSCKKLKQIIVNDDILASSSSSQCPQLEKKMRFPQFKKISITESSSLESFTHVGYHLEFPCLEYLTLEKCYKMMTSFTVDYLTFNVHAKTNQASQVDGASPSQQDIRWKRRRFSSLPQLTTMAGEFFVAAASNTVGSLMDNYVVKPIERRIRYLFSFPKIVQGLHEQKKNLIREQTRVNEDVKEAKLQIQTQVIEDYVIEWLKDTENALKDAQSLDNRIDENKRCLHWCPDWSWRYPLSKEIEKKTVDICKLVEGSHFERIGHPAVLPDLESLPPEGIVIFKSSTAAFNKIMEALEDDKIKMIGVWGMGGVGKTTLVKRVSREIKGFDRVIFVTVSATPDNGKIQDKIADVINLKFEKKTEEGKAAELWSRLKDGKFLVILDDLWNEWNDDVHLKKIGIPLVENGKGCTLILTTRRSIVCESIKCQVTIPIDVLNGDEAWALFRMKADLDKRVLASNIVEEAKKVAQECKGLPVAIVTVASALKDAHTRQQWRLARNKLEKSRLPEIGNIEEREVENAYRCIELSFDYLKKATTKRCFLFCALYPEDHSIPVEDLVRYAWGLELYGLADSVEDVRIQVSEAIKFLKESCLLLEDEDKYKDVGRYVKLHDIVRDVALWITSKPESGFTIKTRLDGSFEPCKAISLLDNEEKNLPEKLAHSKLEMLLLNNCDIQVTCFQGMKELKVLSLTLARDSPKMISLYALASLEKLRTLHLENFEDLSFLGNLGALEILTLRWSCLEGLAEELERLKNLKILDVTYCTLSSRFPTNVIGRMFKLEELYLQGNNKVNFDDTLPEIKSLSRTRLTALSVNVPSSDVMEGFDFSKLERYNISIGRAVLTEKSWEIQEVIPLNVVSLLPESLESLQVSASTDEFMECLIDKGLMLSNLKVLLVGNWSGITELPTQHVRVEGLVHLRIKYCSSLELLFPLSLVQSLVSLETLEVSRCQGLKQIVTELEGDEVEEEINSLHSHFHSVCFPKLGEVNIEKCDGLEYIFPALMGKQGHQGLSLSIRHCPQLKQVIKVENDVMLQQLQFLGSLSSFSVENCHLLVARLQATKATLRNVCLSSFKRSFNRSKHLELCETFADHNMVPDANGDGLNGLTSLRVEKCNDFECLVDTTTENGPTSALTRLETLTITRSNGLETLCKGQPPHGFLKNLKELSVEHCSKLQVVFQMEQIQGIFKVPAHSFSLQSLEFVHIWNCSKLESLFSPSLPLCLPKLKTLHISRCSKLECVVPITLAQEGLAALESLQVLGCKELKQIFGMGNGQHGVEHHHHGEIESNTSPCPLCFPKLKRLEISCCSKLECLVPMTLAQEGLPALESLKVFDCEELKQVFGMGNGQDGVEHHGEIESNTSPLPLCLPKLKTLHIDSCSKLECVVPITLAQEGLPALESLKVSDCEELKQVFGMEKGEDGVEHDGEIESIRSPLPLCLPKLNTLEISRCSKLECVVPENYIVKAPVLKNIIAFKCPEVTNIPIQQASKQLSLETDELSTFKKLSYNTDHLSLNNVWDHKMLVPGADLGHLDRLTSLKITNSYHARCLVDTSEAMKGQPFLQNLKTLTMVNNLCNLRWIVKGPTHCVNLQSLKVLYITYCGELRSLFSVSVVQTLVSLEQLKITKCFELKSVFMKLDGTEPDTFRLPNLKTLEIKNCPSLEYAFPLALAASFPRLQELKLENLGSLRSIVEGNICLEAPALEIFHVCQCSAFADINLLKQVNNYVPLKELTYSSGGGAESKNMENSHLCQISSNLIGLRDLWKGPINVATNLKEVVISKSNCLTYIFPVMLIPHLPQLSSLKIKSCEKLKQIIVNDDILASSSSSQGTRLEKKMEFPQLKEMILEDLPRLESFIHEGYHLELPCLEELKLVQYYKMITSFTVDYLTLTVHAKANRASQVDDASPSQQDIDWKRRRFSSLPQYTDISRSDNTVLLDCTLNLDSQIMNWASCYGGNVVMPIWVSSLRLKA
ncbi:hypothetical protein GQ457_13G004770 [Hibiscus cannabinus]